MALRNLLTRRRPVAAIPGCTERVCRSEMRHGACFECGDLTCSRGGWIDPVTKARRVPPLCTACMIFPNRAQQRLRTERAREDWEKVTDPVDTTAIRAGLMPEQIPGPTRAALRAFHVGADAVAVVPDVGAATLNQSIRTLGLHGEMYAETRGTQTVLRKVG